MARFALPFVLVLLAALLTAWFVWPRQSEEQRLLSLADTCSAQMQRAIILAHEEPRIIWFGFRGDAMDVRVERQSLQVDERRLLEMRALLKGCGLSGINTGEFEGAKGGGWFHSARNTDWQIVRDPGGLNFEGEAYVDDIEGEIKKGDPDRHLFLGRKIDQDWRIEYGH